MRRKLTYDEFVNRSNLLFDFAYNYSKFVYINNDTKGVIICPLHGEFLQKPKNHMSGQRCSGCTNNKKHTTETFIEKANYIHQNKYDYSQVCYINSATKVKIICPVHGMFEQKPNNHLSSGQGCPKCKESKIERQIRSWLTRNKLDFNSQFKIFGCTNKRSLIFDFAIFDEANLVGLIEYNGQEHYNYQKGLNDRDKQASIKFFQKIQRRDTIKQNYCREHDIPLLVISYTEVKEVNDILRKFVAKSSNLTTINK